MSQRITADNLEQVIELNKEIKSDIIRYADIVRSDFNPNRIISSPQLAFDILYQHGLLQVPIDDSFWSGAIFVRDGKKIPAINTALPRVNQYFTAWHEVYHLLFDKVSFDHMIEADTYIEERKAEHFAAIMLLGDVLKYYYKLQEFDFESRIFYCMSLFGAPYKAVLISLYESAAERGISSIKEDVMSSFDRHYNDMPLRFRNLGLDDSIVCPSYVINAGLVASRITEEIETDKEASYHKTNRDFLLKTLQNIRELTEEQYA